MRTDSVIVRKPPRNESGRVCLVTTEKEKINKDDDIIKASEGNDWKCKGFGEVLGKSDEALDYFAKFTFLKTFL